jgi:hypothetical protein
VLLHGLGERALERVGQRRRAVLEQAPVLVPVLADDERGGEGGDDGCGEGDQRAGARGR